MFLTTARDGVPRRPPGRMAEGGREGGRAPICQMSFLPSLFAENRADCLFHISTALSLSHFLSLSLSLPCQMPNELRATCNLGTRQLHFLFTLPRFKFKIGVRTDIKCKNEVHEGREDREGSNSEQIIAHERNICAKLGQKTSRRP